MTIFEFQKMFPTKKSAIDFIIKVKHMQTYMDEFCFRMNHRETENGFANLVKLSVAA